MCIRDRDEDNFILNEASGDKMWLRSNGRGSYLMDVHFDGGDKTSITVDSGAEENVCPLDWGSQFHMKGVTQRMSFRNASGGEIEHHGTRDVLVTSSF